MSHAPVHRRTDDPDFVVLGAGPAGLGAALAGVRHGARVTLVDQSPGVGGLCVTRRSGARRYDLGGHIPFVPDAARRAWLSDLLGDDLTWVPRPVASLRDGRIRPGRYLDQRPPGIPLGQTPRPLPDPGPRESARAVLEVCVGQAVVDAEMRDYLEKIDGVPLARIPGSRALRLMLDQAAPDGFWFPRLGIGQLMDGMADAFVGAGGRLLTGTPLTAVAVPDDAVAGVSIRHGDRVEQIATRHLVVSAPPAGVARCLVPAIPPSALPPVRMRAVAIVYLEVVRPGVTDQAWVQVDDPRVPAARIFEARNWSADLCPDDRTVIGLECYCMPTSDDPVWSADDRTLAARCAATLVDPLGWIDRPAEATPIEVVRLAAGYPLPDLDQIDAVSAAPALLDRIAGLHLARGSAVIDAIRAGEDCAATALSAAR